MFGMGTGELVMLALVGTVIWLGFRILGRLSSVERFFARRAEKTALVRGTMAAPSGPLRPIPLPFTLGVQIAGAVLMILLAAEGALSMSDLNSVDRAAGIVGSLFTTTGIVLHFRAPWRRRFKYEIFGVGSSLIWLLLGVVFAAAFQYDNEASVVGVRTVAWVVLVPVVFSFWSIVI